MSSNNISGDHQDSVDYKMEMGELPKLQNLPISEYYGQSLFPLLQKGLKETALARPDNPIKFLGEYLIKHSQ